MVVEILITIITKIIAVFVWLLPSWAIPQNFIDGFLSIINSAHTLNLYIPIFSMLNVIAIILAFEFLVLSVRLTSGLLSLIRGGGKIEV